MEWKRKHMDGKNAIQLKEKNGVYYFQFPLLEACAEVAHGFSTRIGGVSKGEYASMNFSFTRGDDKEAVMENYRRMGEVLGMPWQRCVLSHQTHTVHVRRVTEADAGKGICRERDYQDVDGLITNERQIPLVTFYADCVPLYFVDPVHHAIGLSHSGWRGTVSRMGRETLLAMHAAYGTDPGDVLACIGPSICKDCYEVGEEVAMAFAESVQAPQLDSILKKQENGKYLLNLWKANERVLLEAGVRPEHLAVTDVCTKCNPDLLYSHRVMGDKRGNLAAFLMLK
ncbi:MAG: peptidoglycan editing factor PgeF [Lachnospiraceae bacterium]|nr:peptidoglycan editing factor PgeF [Candidatus Fimimorpha excrementavium]